MLHYSLIASFLLIVPVFSNILKSHKAEKVGFGLCVGVLMFLAAFRASSVGNDTEEYLRIFEETISSGIYESRYEIGYLWLNKLLGYISHDSQIVLIVSSIFIFYSFGRFIWKYSEMPWLSLFLFFTYGFFSSSLNIMRQSLAMAILLFSYDFLLQGKNLKFVLSVLFASLFHTTAFLFISSYICRKLHITVKLVIIFVGISILFSYLFSVLLDSLFGVLAMYEHYKDGKYSGGTRLASILYIIISSFIFIFSYCILKQKKLQMKFSDSQFLCNNCMLITVLIAVACYIVSIKLNLLDRVAIYFNMISIVLLPNIIYSLTNRNRMLLISCTILFFFIYSAIIVTYRPEWNSLYPYSFCW